MFKEYIAYIKDNPERKWFKRKLYGWGWTPARWQGWLTLIIFIMVITAHASLFAEHQQADSAPVMKFIGGTAILVAILILICWKTGERPKWQWGIPDKYKKK